MYGGSPNFFTNFAKKYKPSMSNNESSILNIVRFAMMISVLMLHSYTSIRACQNVSSLPVYSVITRLFSWQFGELGIPVFSVISGYLFFKGY